MTDGSEASTSPEDPTTLPVPEDPTAAPAAEDPTTLPAADSARPRPPTDPLLHGSRRLVGASFDLLARSSDELRRASFYIGAVAFGTLAPLAMGAWWIAIQSVHMTEIETESMLAGPVALWVNMLVWPAILGLLVITVESRAMAAAILAARIVERPLTLEQALARARMVFWRTIGAGLVAGIPIALTQLAIEAAVDSVAPVPGQASLPISLLVTAVVGGPLAYVTSGVVLGDVEPVEALRRSIRVFRVRKVAAIVVALFETIAALLIVFGVSAGLDLALRVFESLGLGTDSGPAGIVLVTVGVVAASFALGTLIFTVSAIAIAPQVVMFVGLTHATMGLDHVRLGGNHDPLTARPGRPRFRIFPRSMVMGVVVAWIGVVALALQLRA